ncbi:MAG: hypothetical protein AAB969_01365 [Patescibacteria group bacterium]
MDQENKNQASNYIICPNCQGQGRICSLCGQKGIGLWLDGYFLYWDKVINLVSILQNKIYKAIQLVINIILFVIGALGIFSLGWKVTQVFIPGISWFDSWRFIFETDIFMLSFWLGITAGLYLFYRFN